MPQSLDLSPAAISRYTEGAALDQSVPSEREGLHPALWALMLGAEGADIATTLAAQRRGGREANPVVRGIADNPWALSAVKLGAHTGVGALLHQLHKHKPKTAKTLAVISAAIPALAALHNHGVKRDD